MANVHWYSWLLAFGDLEIHNTTTFVTTIQQIVLPLIKDSTFVEWGTEIYDNLHNYAAYIQGESLARGPKLLSIKSYVIEIMTWKFIYTYRERCKTGPAHNRCWNWSPFTSKHTWKRFSKFWNTFPKVSTSTAWISWRIESLSCSIVRGVFLYTLPFNRPQRKKSAGVRSASPCL